MKFIEVDNSALKKNGEVIAMLDEFLKSDAEVAEVVEWDGIYKNYDQAGQGIRHAVNKYFSGKIKSTRNNGRIFIEKIAKEKK